MQVEIEKNIVAEIKEALCISCLKPANLVCSSHLLCKECYEWLGWNQMPEKLTKFGNIRTLADLALWKSGYEGII